MQKIHIMFSKKIVCFVSLCAVLLSGMIFVLAELGGYGVNGPATAPNSLDYGLVGYWDFEEEGQVVKDKSGNDNDGTLGSDSSAGTDDPVFVPGHNSAGLNGRGLGFDGVNDYADLGNDSILTSNSGFSYSFWMKWSGANKGGYGGLVQYLNRGTQNYRILIEDSASKIIVQDTGGTRLTSASSFSQGVFYHITLTWDGSLPRLYVNGKSDATGSAADFASAMANNIKIGVGADWTSTYYFNGVMDEVRIYNRVLSEDEIRLLYNQKKPILHLKMDEGAGVNLYDESFNNYDAKVYSKINTAISATSDTLYDNDVNWTTNGLSGREVSIVYGTGVGQIRTISSNTNNTLTVSQNWDVVPDNTSRYVITLNSSNVWTAREGQPALNLADIGYAGFAPAWAPISGTGEFTLEAWIKTSSGNRQVIMAQRGPGGVNGGYLLEINSSGKAYYWDFSGAYGHNFYSNKTVNDNNWHHIAFTRSGNMGYLYIDEVLDKTSTGTAINIVSSLDFEVGTDFRDAIDYFNGSMDDIRVYNYARTADEIRADYNDNSAARLGAGAINLDYGLVGYWDMEEGEGQTLYDKSGNGNDIILGSSASGDSADPVFAPGHNSTGENGTSLKFDGINDYAGRPDSKSLDLTTALTMSMWVNSRFLAADVFSLAGKTCGGGAGDHHYKLSTNGPLLQLAVGDGACGTGNVDSLDQAGFFTGYENK